MAQNDAAVLVAGSGNFFTAAVDTELPVDLLDPGVAWTSVGHTSLDNIFGVASDGGDPTTIGTFQNKILRTQYSPRTETFSIVLEQFDEPGLKLYYGSNAPILTDGSIGVPVEPVPTTAAFLAVFYDGANAFALWAPKSEIYRNDDLSIADTESLAGLPVGVKPMISGSNAYTYAVTPLGTVATGALAGLPGDFTPQGAAHPASLADMTGVIASPLTAWTVGQYVTVGDGTKVHWSSTAWVTGVA